MTSETSKFEFQIVGLQDPVELSVRKAIGERWGISYKTVAGCVVTSELMKDVEANNEAVAKNLTQKFGKDWRKKFESEVDAERKTRSEVLLLINKNELVQKAIQESDASIHISYGDKGIYVVYVQSFMSQNGMEPALYNIYTLTVDTKTNTVAVLSDTPEKVELRK